MTPCSTTAAAADAAHALTPWGMFLQADPVVKAVMVGLLLASVLTWTVMLAKAREFARARGDLARARDLVVCASGLDDVAIDPAMQSGAPHAFLDAARTELRLSAGIDATDGLRERVASRLERLEIACARELRVGTGVLATIGATAPFIGLFGTVWGIMNSFVGIAASNTTSLAVVAPGIAEALLATALGLVAAIPAVIIHNQFSRTLGGLRGQLGDLSAGLQQLVSRDLDRAR